jgi:carbamoyl-phosphate synthase large subunit
MNVLLTCVGRRAYLVDYFRQALGGTGQVVVTNSHTQAAGMQVADVALVVAPVASAGYAESIAQICATHEIGLLCSLHDLDTTVLAQFGGGFARAASTLPDAHWAQRCLDKLECQQFLRSHGISSPWTSPSLSETLAALDSGEIRLPIVIKERNGFGSGGLRICRSRQELECWGAADGAAEAPRIFQEFVVGTEFRLNLVNDLAGVPRATFACKVDSMRAGESDRATTVDPQQFAALAAKLAGLTKHAGIWGIDMIVSNDVCYVLDINPRFTGDYPFQHLAGANVPAALVAWARGEPVAPEWLQPAIGVSGYKDIVLRLG